MANGGDCVLCHYVSVGAMSEPQEKRMKAPLSCFSERTRRDGENIFIWDFSFGSDYKQWKKKHILNNIVN